MRKAICEFIQDVLSSWYGWIGTISFAMSLIPVIWPNAGILNLTRSRWLIIGLCCLVVATYSGWYRKWKQIQPRLDVEFDEHDPQCATGQTEPPLPSYRIRITNNSDALVHNVRARIVLLESQGQSTPLPCYLWLHLMHDNPESGWDGPFPKSNAGEDLRPREKCYFDVIEQSDESTVRIWHVVNQTGRELPKTPLTMLIEVNGQEATANPNLFSAAVRVDSRGFITFKEISSPKLSPVQKWRQSHKVRRAEFANNAGISENTLLHIEQGKQPICSKLLEYLGSLGVDTDEFTTEQRIFMTIRSKGRHK